MVSAKYKIGILTSGMSRGSNLEAMANYFIINQKPVQISFAIVTKKNAPVREKCMKYHINDIFISTKDLQLFEDKLIKVCHENSIDILVLSGFLKKLSPKFIKRVNIPVINIHPALLPKFGGLGMYGKNVHEKVFNFKEKKSGVTIHLVNENYDEGKIIAQSECDISDCKSADEIADKVLTLEHKVYPQTITRFLENLR